jgi:hypothetical protein
MDVHTLVLGTVTHLFAQLLQYTRVILGRPNNITEGHL